MLDRVATIVLGLDGKGGAESLADYAQWESWQAENKTWPKMTNGSISPDIGTNEVGSNDRSSNAAPA
jgi:ATP-binding cassette subfamily F protein uup